MSFEFEEDIYEEYLKVRKVFPSLELIHLSMYPA